MIYNSMTFAKALAELAEEAKAISDSEKCYDYTLPDYLYTRADRLVDQFRELVKYAMEED